MQQAELLHKALKRLGIERPVFAGHSWGAIVALSLAARHPADTAGLVLLFGGATHDADVWVQGTTDITQGSCV